MKLPPSRVSNHTLSDTTPSRNEKIMKNAEFKILAYMISIISIIFIVNFACQV